ncbi:MAG: TRAP transporter large permease, partial [Candidatus Heimdallarchaeaceae archaeon]
MEATLFLLFFLVLSTPVFVAIGTAAILSTIFFSDIPLIMVSQRMFYSVDSVILMAGPFFTLSGIIITRGRLAKQLVEFFKALFCFIPGGLAIATVVTCAAFGAITGSAVASMMAIGSIMIPVLKNAGYEESFSAGFIAPSSTLGVLIPPSVPMIVYCAVADLSVGRLFAAGFAPGLLITFLLSISILILAVKKDFPTEPFSFRRVWRTFIGSLWAISFPILVLGVIYTGICTPTEASAIAVFYAFFIEYVIYKSFPIKELKSILIDTSLLVGAIFIIIASASVLASYWTLEQIPEMLAQKVTSFITQPWVFILTVNILLLIVGCLMDEISAILILVPLLSVLLEKYGINPYHFAIIFLINMNIGFVTPPVGLNLLTAAIITDIPLMKIARKSIYFLFVLLIGLIIVSYWES